MASSVFIFDNDKYENRGVMGVLVVGIFEISDVSIRSIWSIGPERCDPPRCVMHISGPASLCRSWICDSPAIYQPLWQWSYGTHTTVINNLKAFCSIYLSIFSLICVRQRYCWLVLRYFFHVLKNSRDLEMLTLQTIYFISVIFPVFINF